MSSQRRHEGKDDSQPSFPSTQKGQNRIRFPHLTADSDRPYHRTPVESADQKHRVWRDGDGKHHNSSHNSRPDASGYYQPISSSNPALPPTASTRKTTHSAVRPPSRYAPTRPTQPTNATAQSSYPTYTQNQGRSQPQRSQPDMPEIRDLRDHLKKRTPAAPTPKSSYEQISGLEDGPRSTHHTRSRSATRPYTPAPPATAVQNPPMQHPSDYYKRYGGGDAPKEERYRERDPEKYREIEGDRSDRRYRDKERAMPVDRIKEKDKTQGRDKARERGWTKERERYAERQEETERERRPLGDFRRVSKPPLPSRDHLDLRSEDHDSSDSARRTYVVPSSHRRYRSDEVTTSAPANRQQSADRSRFPLPTSSTWQTLPTSSNPPVPTHQSASTDHAVVSQRHVVPPTPQAMPVRLSEREAKSYKPYHDKSASYPIDLPTATLSGSDTDRAKWREPRVRNDPNNPRGIYMEFTSHMSESRRLGSAAPEQVNQGVNLQASSSYMQDTKVVREPRISTSRTYRPQIIKPDVLPPDPQSNIPGNQIGFSAQMIENKHSGLLAQEQVSQNGNVQAPSIRFQETMVSKDLRTSASQPQRPQVSRVPDRPPATLSSDPHSLRGRQAEASAPVSEYKSSGLAQVPGNQGGKFQAVNPVMAESIPMKEPRNPASRPQRPQVSKLPDSLLPDPNTLRAEEKKASLSTSQEPTSQRGNSQATNTRTQETANAREPRLSTYGSQRPQVSKLPDYLSNSLPHDPRNLRGNRVEFASEERTASQEPTTQGGHLQVMNARANETTIARESKTSASGSQRPQVSKPPDPTPNDPLPDRHVMRVNDMESSSRVPENKSSLLGPQAQTNQDRNPQATNIRVQESVNTKEPRSSGSRSQFPQVSKPPDSPPNVLSQNRQNATEPPTHKPETKPSLSASQLQGENQHVTNTRMQEAPLVKEPRTSPSQTQRPQIVKPLDYPLSITSPYPSSTRDHTEPSVRMQEVKPSDLAPQGQRIQGEGLQAKTTRLQEPVAAKESRVSAAQSRPPLVPKTPDYTPPAVSIPYSGISVENRQRDGVPQFPSASPRLKVLENPFATTRPLFASVHAASDEPAQRGIFPMGNSLQVNVVSSPVIEVRTALAPVIQLSASVFPSQAVSLGSLDNAAHTSKSSPHSTKKNMTSETEVPPAPQPSRLTSYNANVAETNPSASLPMSRAPSAGVVPQPSVVSVYPPSRTVSSDNRPNRNEVRPYAPAISSQLPLPDTGTMYPSPPARQNLSAMNQVVAQAPFSPPRPEVQDIRSPSFLHPTLPSLPFSRAAAANGLSDALHHVPPPASRAPSQPQPDENRSPRQLAAAKVPSSPSSPVVFTKTTFPSSDRKDVQSLYLRINNQDPTPVVTELPTSSVDTAERQRNVLPLKASTEDPTKSSPKTEKYRTHTSQIQPTIAVQSAPNAGHLQRDQGERSELRLPDTLGASRVNLNQPLQPITGGVETRSLPSVVPQYFVPPQQPTSNTVSRPLKVEDRPELPTRNVVGVSHATAGSLTQPDPSDLPTKSHPPSVPRHFVPTPQPPPKLVNNPLKSEERSDLPLPDSPSYSKRNVGSQGQSVSFNSGMETRLVVPTHSVSVLPAPKIANIPLNTDGRSEAPFPDPVNVSHTGFQGQPVSRNAVAKTNPAIVPQHFIPDPPAVTKVVNNPPKVDERPNLPLAEYAPVLQLSRGPPVQPASSRAPTKPIPASLSQDLVPAPLVTPKVPSISTKTSNQPPPAVANAPPDSNRDRPVRITPDDGGRNPVNNVTGQVRGSPPQPRMSARSRDEPAVSRSPILTGAPNIASSETMAATSRTVEGAHVQRRVGPVFESPVHGPPRKVADPEKLNELPSVAVPVVHYPETVAVSKMTTSTSRSIPNTSQQTKPSEESQVEPNVVVPVRCSDPQRSRRPTGDQERSFVPSPMIVSEIRNDTEKVTTPKATIPVSQSIPKIPHAENSTKPSPIVVRNDCEVTIPKTTIPVSQSIPMTPLQMRLSELLSSKPAPPRVDPPTQLTSRTVPPHGDPPNNATSHVHNTAVPKASEDVLVVGGSSKRDYSERVTPQFHNSSPQSTKTSPPLAQVSERRSLDVKISLPVDSQIPAVVKRDLVDQKTEHHISPLDSQSLPKSSREQAKPPSARQKPVEDASPLFLTSPRFPIDENLLQSHPSHSIAPSRGPGIYGGYNQPTASTYPPVRESPASTPTLPPRSRNAEPDQIRQSELPAIPSMASSHHGLKEPGIPSSDPSPVTLRSASVNPQAEVLRSTGQISTPPAGPAAASQQQPSRSTLPLKDTVSLLPVSCSTPNSNTNPLIHRATLSDSRVPVLSNVPEVSTHRNTSSTSVYPVSKLHSSPPFPTLPDASTAMREGLNGYQPDSRLQSSTLFSSQPYVSATAPKSYENSRGAPSSSQVPAERSLAISTSSNLPRLPETQVPRTTSSSIHPTAKPHSPPSSTSYPDIPTTARRTQDGYQSDTRLQSNVQSYSFSHVPATTPRLYEHPKGIYPSSQASTERPYVTPTSYPGTRLISKARDSSSRTRDTTHATFSTTVPNSSLSNVNSDRSRPSMYPYASFQSSSINTQHQPNVSLTSTSGPIPTSQSQPTLIRTQLSTASHNLSQSYSASASQVMTNSTRTPASLHVPSTKRPPLDGSTSSDSEALYKATPSNPPPIYTKPASSGMSGPATSSSQRDQDSRKKSNALNISRGRIPDSTPREMWYPTSSAKTFERSDPRPEPRPSSKPTSVSAPTGAASSGVRAKAPAPITVPVPIPEPMPSGRMSPNTVFTPFRLSARRYRTVSAASLEALDGTAANTVVGSPTASMLSQTPQLPPMRDPVVAAWEWRNREEAEMVGRGTGRRRRPGVVFDVAE